MKKAFPIGVDAFKDPITSDYYYVDKTPLIKDLLDRKGNQSLAFAVIAGCLQISKESIFTGLNNLKVISALSNDDFEEYFGFTQDEMM